MPTRVFRYPGSATSVACDDPADLRWLIDFLRPSFWSRRSGDFQWSVALVRSDEENRRLRERYRGAPRKRKGVFYLDTRVEQLRVLDDDNGRRTLLDPVGDAVCLVNSRTKQVRITAPSRRWAARITLMRFVRERAMRAVLEHRGILMHAAGFVLDGRAVLIAGHKRSGKSSLLLHTLRSAAHQGTGAGSRRSLGTNPVLDIRYLSNDRAMLQIDRGSIGARGLPTIASLRIDGLDQFPGLATRIGRSGFYPALTRTEVNRWGPAGTEPWEGRKFTLSPSQLCELTGARAAAAAPLGAVVFPTVTEGGRGIRVRRLSHSDALAALRTGLFRAGRRVQVGELFSVRGSSPAPRPGELESVLDAVAARVGCYAVELGPRAYRGTSWLNQAGKLVGP